MSGDNHHQESPKKVFFGIPLAFAVCFWFITFISLKACDGPSDCCGRKNCCSTESCEKCSPECKANCTSDEEKAGASEASVKDSAGGDKDEKGEGKE